RPAGARPALAAHLARKAGPDHAAVRFLPRTGTGRAPATPPGGAAAAAGKVPGAADPLLSRGQDARTGGAGAGLEARLDGGPARDSPRAIAPPPGRPPPGALGRYDRHAHGRTGER